MFISYKLCINCWWGALVPVTGGVSAAGVAATNAAANIGSNLSYATNGGDSTSSNKPSLKNLSNKKAEKNCKKTWLKIGIKALIFMKKIAFIPIFLNVE